MIEGILGGLLGTALIYGVIRLYSAEGKRRARAEAKLESANEALAARRRMDEITRRPAPKRWKLVEWARSRRQ